MKLVIRYIVTIIIFVAGYCLRGMPALVWVGLAVAFGFLLARIWTNTLISAIVKPFISIVDGGDEPPVPMPNYSIIEAKRKKGLFKQAIQETRSQLRKFPNDFNGTVMLATIQAEDLSDLLAAEETINLLLAIPGHPPRCVAGALHLLADWHLRYSHDINGARVALERIPALFPDSQWSQIAYQRIARLDTTGEMLRQKRGPIILPRGERDIGLNKEFQVAIPEPEAVTIAANYVKQLEKFPQDSDTRERLALLYVKHFHRYDLAIDELEQLIAQPNESAKRIANWLNILVTVHLQNNDLASAQQTLRRITEQFHGLAAGDMAITRLASLKSELKRKDAIAIKLGTYEHDFGLNKRQL